MLTASTTFAGATQFTHLSGLAIGIAAGVSWDGKYVAAADQDYQLEKTTAINEITVSGSAITVVATWNYTDDCYQTATNNAVIQPFIVDVPFKSKGGTVVGSNLWCDSRLDLWPYHASGNPKRVYAPSLVPHYGLYGQSVSAKKS